MDIGIPLECGGERGVEKGGRERGGEEGRWEMSACRVVNTAPWCRRKVKNATRVAITQHGVCADWLGVFFSKLLPGRWLRVGFLSPWEVFGAEGTRRA